MPYQVLKDRYGHYDHHTSLRSLPDPSNCSRVKSTETDYNNLSFDDLTLHPLIIQDMQTKEIYLYKPKF